MRFNFNDALPYDDKSLILTQKVQRRLLFLTTEWNVFYAY